MSISPDDRAVKRCLADRGEYLTAEASPNTAAATARHISTSNPVQLPLSSGFEKPGRPWLTPHWMKPLARTSSRVPACTADAAVNAATPATIRESFFIFRSLNCENCDYMVS